MQAFDWMVAAGSVTALGLSVFAVVSDLKDGSVAPSPTEMVVSEKQVSAPSQEMLKQDVATLKQQAAPLTAATTVASEERQTTGVSRQEVAALRDEVAALREQLESVLTGRPAADDESAESQVLFPDDLEIVIEDQALKHSQRIAAIDAGFRAEPVSDDWSVETTDLILQAFQTEEMVQSDMLSAECRASMCKVEVSHDNADDFQLFQMQFILEVGEALPAMTIEQYTDDNGSINSVMYLTRTGFEESAVNSAN